MFDIMFGTPHKLLYWGSDVKLDVNFSFINFIEAKYPVVWYIFMNNSDFWFVMVFVLTIIFVLWFLFIGDQRRVLYGFSSILPYNILFVVSMGFNLIFHIISWVYTVKYNCNVDIWTLSFWEVHIGHCIMYEVILLLLILIYSLVYELGLKRLLYDLSFIETQNLSVAEWSELLDWIDWNILGLHVVFCYLGCGILLEWFSIGYLWYL